jgi:hypothetical protein
MLWNTLRAIGEVVATFVVVAILVYLAALIRAQKKELKIAPSYGISVENREVMTAICE